MVPVHVLDGLSILLSRTVIVDEKNDINIINHNVNIVSFFSYHTLEPFRIQRSKAAVVRTSVLTIHTIGTSTGLNHFAGRVVAHD